MSRLRPVRQCVAVEGAIGGPPHPPCKVSRAIAIVVWLLCALPAAALADGIFRGTFDSEGLVPLQFATIELRDAAGGVKATTSTDIWRTFRPFASTQIETGDSIVAYGGIWGGQTFAGEFRLLLDESSASQEIGVITTLVSTLAGSDQVQGTTPAQRLANAVMLLKSYGLIDDDWRQGSPARVNYPVDEAVTEEGGIQNWVATLLTQVQEGEIDSAFMGTFPHANGGILDLAIAADAASWLPGDDGKLTLRVSHSLQAAPAWDFEAVNVPVWMTVSPEGELAFQVPSDATPSVQSLQVRVSNPETSAGRILELAFRIEDGAITAQATFDAAGVTLWHPNGNIGVEVPAGAVVEATGVQWVDYADAEGKIVNLLRFVPRDREFSQPVQIVFPTLRAGAGTKSVEDCWSQVEPEHLEPGWFAKLHCELANFIRIEQRPFLSPFWFTLIGTNRVAGNLEFPPSLPVQARNLVQPASTLTARCGGSSCQGREPVLFVHGYTSDGKFGGGTGTWQELPELVHEWSSTQTPIRFAAYEFRYRSNARFEEIATDLGHAIELIYAETGHRKVRIVAHSFGGLVARTYLQGLVGNIAIGGEVSSCAAPSRHPFVESLLTVGTPHSGIASAPQSLNGLWLPKGQHGLGGAGIGKCGEWKFAGCGDLTVWQAGEEGPFDDVDEQRFTASYQVANQPGRIIARLSNFSENPLPVPTLALVGLLHQALDVSSVAVASGGDGLISYQGQRFSPRLSCTGETCTNRRIGAAAVQSIGTQPLGHCLSEQVLGAQRSNFQPIPDTVLGDQTIINNYRHSSALVWRLGVAAEPGVKESSHLPGQANGTPQERQHYGATHDSFNRVLSWILAGEVEPLVRNVDVTVSGTGSVEIISNGQRQTCVSATPYLGETKCLLTAAADSTIKYVPEGGASLLPGFPLCLDPSGCRRYFGAYESIKARFTPSDLAALRVQVLGAGTVSPISGGECVGPGECFFFAQPNSIVTLMQQPQPTGVWNEWSGACSGAGNDCVVILGQARSTVSVTASFTGGANPTPSGTQPLNDTGIQFCGGAEFGSDICDDTHPQGQDAHYGRDAQAALGQLSKIGGGNAGFDFTKISNSGSALPASATLGSGANDWACTRDNVTGLIWEVKVGDSSHYRYMEHGYTWYDPDSPDGNPGIVGDTSSCSDSLDGQNCNTHTFTQAVNEQGLCGASDWRMPTRRELQGIVDYGRHEPAIDSSYFANTPSAHFWSGSPHAYDLSLAWHVYFGVGGASNRFRGFTDRVRLMRRGQ